MNLIMVGIVAALVAVTSVSAQSSDAGGGYPVIPRTLADSEEIQLARSAAPAEISGAASVYVVRDGKAHLLRAGTNGCACMVARDLHEGSLYPICFDVEATKSVLPRELMEGTLRSAGRSEEEVMRAVDSAYESGTLRAPATLAIAYMMSSRQVLFSSPLAEGRRVGAWHPHLMFYVPNATPEQLGLLADSRVSVIAVGAPRTKRAEIIVRVPAWADSAGTAP
jgi:hypothetical protein